MTSPNSNSLAPDQYEKAATHILEKIMHRRNYPASAHIELTEYLKQFATQGIHNAKTRNRS